LLDGVHPETKDFGRDQGARKILPQAYDLLYSGLHVIINHLVSEYSIMGKWILVSGVVETENNNSVIHSHRFRIDTAEVTEAKNTPDGQ